MQQVVFLLVAVGLGIVVFKVRGDAARERKAVMARLDSERAERGDYSPTAELFREVGADPSRTVQFPPPPGGAGGIGGVGGDDGFVFERLSEVAEDLPQRVGRVADTLPDDTAPEPDTDAEVAPEPAPEPAATLEPETPGDIRRLFRGIAMPAGLRPLGPLQSSQATFVTDVDPATVRDGLIAEFDRLGCDATWVEPTVAQTARHGERGLVTIYPNPASLVDLDGTPAFADVAAGQVVVRMLALS